MNKTLFFILIILLIINFVIPETNNYINYKNYKQKFPTYKSTDLTKNIENKYDLTFNTNCIPILNIIFKFNNYYFTNTTSFNLIEEKDNIIFHVDNMFKNTFEDVKLSISNIQNPTHQIITYTFTGFKYDINNVFKVNIVLDECNNFKNYIQYSSVNDLNVANKISRRVYSNDDNIFNLNIPYFQRNSEQSFKLFLVENDVVILNSYFTIGFSIIILLLLMTQ